MRELYELVRDYTLKCVLFVWLVLAILMGAGCASAPQLPERPAVVVVECDPMTTVEKIRAMMSPIADSPLAPREEYRSGGRSVVVVRSRCMEG